MSTFNEKVNYLKSRDAFHDAPLSVLLRLAYWKCHCTLGIPGTISLRRSARMYLPPRWRSPSKLFFAFRDQFERELKWLPFALSEGGVFVDAGACYGIYSLIAASLVGPSGRVIAFEPGSEAFSVLSRNLSINGFLHVSARRIALKNEPGTSRLFVASDLTRNTLGHRPGAGKFEEVLSNTLDEELATLGVENVTLMKIDTEGAEELILRGAENTLRRSHPKIIFELNADAAHLLGGRPDGAWNLLRDLGYRFWTLDEDMTLQPLFAPIDFGNVIAIHHDDA